MAAGVTDKLWEVGDIVGMLEQWELANFKPEYQFAVRQYAIGKGHPGAGGGLEPTPIHHHILHKRQPPTASAWPSSSDMVSRKTPLSIATYDRPQRP
jgi:hypothetical protein